MSKQEKAFKIGLIRVLTSEDPEVLYAHQKQIMEKFPTLTVETKCIPAVSYTHLGKCDKSGKDGKRVCSICKKNRSRSGRSGYGA